MEKNRPIYIKESVTFKQNILNLLVHNSPNCNHASKICLQQFATICFYELNVMLDKTYLEIRDF